MEVTIKPLPDEQQAEMLRLLSTNTEMLHDYPKGKRHCRYCGQFRTYAGYADECRALLRHALELTLEAAAHFAHCRQCGEVSISTCDEGGRDYAIKLGLYKPD